MKVKLLMNYLIENNITVSCAESCTGGLLIATLINVPGASKIINESYVTYSIEAKERMLGVDPETIEKCGVASTETSIEMAKGLKQKTNSDIAISVTGYAGGTNKNEPNGLFFYTIIINDKMYSEHFQVKGTRNTARRRQVEHIIDRLYELIK